MQQSVVTCDRLAYLASPLMIEPLTRYAFAIFEWCHLELKWLQLFSKAFHLHLTFQLGSVRWRRRPKSNQSAAKVGKLLGKETGLQNTKTIRNRLINHNHHIGHEHGWGEKRIQLENASCGDQAFQALGHIWAHAYPGNKKCLTTLQKVARFYIVPPVFPRAIIPPCSANSASLLHIFATCQLRELFALCQCALFVLLAQLGP